MNLSSRIILLAVSLSFHPEAEETWLENERPFLNKKNIFFKAINFVLYRFLFTLEYSRVIISPVEMVLRGIKTGSGPRTNVV